MAARLTRDAASVWLSGWNRALRRIPIQHPRADWPEFGASISSGFGSGPMIVATRADGDALALMNNDANPAEDRIEILLVAEWRTVRLAQPDP